MKHLFTARIISFYLDFENHNYISFSVKEYFDSNILSNLMAPMFPKYSRNCMWILQTKDLQDQYGLF